MKSNKKTQKPKTKAKKQAKTNVASIVKKELYKSQYELNPNPHGMRFASILLNPFAEEKQDITPGPIPDGASDRVFCTLRGSGTFSGATATSGVFQVGYPCTSLSGTNAGPFQIFTGGDVTLATSTPTAITTGSLPISTGLYNAYIAAMGSHMRGVSCAIRVNPISADDDTSGILRGGLSVKSLLVSTVPAFNDYDSVINGIKEESHQLTGSKSGICVRSKFVPTDFAATPTSFAGTSAVEIGRTPFVIFSGLGAGTILEYEYIVHFELEVHSYLNFMQVMDGTSVYDPEIQEIIRKANTEQIVVNGHSFKTLIKRGYKWAKKNQKFLRYAAGGLKLLL